MKIKEYISELRKVPCSKDYSGKVKRWSYSAIYKFYDREGEVSAEYAKDEFDKIVKGFNFDVMINIDDE